MTRLGKAARSFAALLTAGLFLTVNGYANADFVETFTLDQSNALPNGVSYGTVKVQGSTALGEVTLTYTADPSPYSGTGKNFGFHSIGFNTDLSLTAAQITTPAGWSLSPGANLSQFGRFTWTASTSNQPSPTVVIDITGLGSTVSLADFTVGSTKGTSVFFAGHIIDFSVSGSDVSSQWVGGSTPSNDPPPPPPGGQGGPPPSSSPEPSALLLGGIGLAGMALVSVRKRIRRRA
jgi:hypothetical protein